ncbi:MAG: hypothetical protein L6Q66_02760 [Bacteroidia bacterium]|nr:hypothetical protein [Bacteroidia bacterium]
MILFLTALLSVFNLCKIEHAPSTEWKIEYIDSEIKIESALLIIDDQTNGIKHERVIFRYSNLSSKKINVSFSRRMYYDGKCMGCDNNLDKKMTITLDPSEVIEYTEKNKDKVFYLFSRDLNNTISKKLDSFQITSIEKTY